MEVEVYPRDLFLKGNNFRPEIERIDTRWSPDSVINGVKQPLEVGL